MIKDLHSHEIGLQLRFETNVKYPSIVRTRFSDHDLINLVPIDKSDAIIELREVVQELLKDKPRVILRKRPYIRM